jgi:hypothetical protein
MTRRALYDSRLTNPEGRGRFQPGSKVDERDTLAFSLHALCEMFHKGVNRFFRTPIAATSRPRLAARPGAFLLCCGHE